MYSEIVEEQKASIWNVTSDDVIGAAHTQLFLDVVILHHDIPVTKVAAGVTRHHALLVTAADDLQTTQCSCCGDSNKTQVFVPPAFRRCVGRCRGMESRQ